MSNHAKRFCREQCNLYYNYTNNTCDQTLKILNKKTCTSYVLK